MFNTNFDLQRDILLCMQNVQNTPNKQTNKKPLTQRELRCFWLYLPTEVNKGNNTSLHHFPVKKKRREQSGCELTQVPTDVRF